MPHLVNRNPLLAALVTGVASLPVAGLITPASAAEPERAAASVTSPGPLTVVPVDRSGANERLILNRDNEEDAPPAGRPAPPVTVPGGKKGLITISKFTHLTWSPSARTFRSVGSVTLHYSDPTNPKDKGVTVIANDLTGDLDSGQIESTGAVRFERAEGYLTGSRILFNLNTGNGYLTNAVADTEYFRANGDLIETRADGSYVVRNGTFTTCVKRRPDYQIHAKKLVILPHRYVSATNATIYAGGYPVFYLPAYRRGLQTGTGAPFPTFSYDKNSGVGIRLTDTPIASLHRNLNYDVHAYTRGGPTGSFVYLQDINHNVAIPLSNYAIVSELAEPLRSYLEQINPPTFREFVTNKWGEEPGPRLTVYAVAQTYSGIFNRRISNIFVSRYPDIGFRWANIAGKYHAPATLTDEEREANAPILGDTRTPLTPIPNAPFLLNITGSLAYLSESPSNVTTGRFGIRTDAATQPYILGRRLSFRLGGSNYSNVYGTGQFYDLFTPEADVNYVPTATSLIGAGYRFLTDNGNTPFLFDRLDLRHEVRLRYQVGGPWSFGSVTRIDMERTRVFDSEFAVLRNLDCMQVGFVYHTRNQSFQLVVNLLPPFANRQAHLKAFPNQTSGGGPTTVTDLLETSSNLAK